MPKVSPEKIIERIQEQIIQLEQEKQRIEIKLEALRSALNTDADHEKKPAGFQLMPSIITALTETPNEWCYIDELIERIAKTNEGYKPDKKNVRATLTYLMQQRTDIKKDDTKKGFFKIETQ